VSGVSPEASSLIERLRRALGPTFRVDGEVAQGGMGTVFRAQDLSLGRPVAVKILPLEASADQVERFHREAQILAQLSHPSIVPVYQVSSQDQDLNYYIMQWMEGETVQTRLSRGPMSPREAVDMGIDLLKALAISHKNKVIHRDVKPANVFLVDQRTVLADFGIAKGLTGDRSVLTKPAQMIGTPAYMAPEQWEGSEVTESTDIYAVGLLLYEAMSGKRLMQSSIDAPDWSKIPRRLAQVIRRALAKEPSDRWPDAHSFIRALKAATLPRMLFWAAAVGTLAIIAAAAVYYFTRPLGTIGIMRFESGPGVDTMVPDKLAVLLYSQLRGTGGLHILGLSSNFINQAQTKIHGQVQSVGDSIEVRFGIQQGIKDRWVATIRGHRDSLASISNQLANLIMVELVPVIGNRDVATLSTTPGANQEFVAGEIDFRRVSWGNAERHYSNAVALDSNFALARWRLANVQRWRRLVVSVDLKPLLENGQRLGELDRLLVMAEVEPNVNQRFQLYQDAVTKYPTDGIAWLFYGDELMHRGPLAGRSLSDALTKLEKALANDSSMAAAWFHIGWIQIRLGDRQGAQNALDNQLRVVPIGTSDSDIDMSYFLKLAFAERFEPQKASLEKPTLKQLGQIVRAFRWAISFDIPEAQLKYGQLIDSLSPFDIDRASAHSGQGIALVALGRPLEALTHFDRAHALRASTESDLHRAQWRVIPPAMRWYPLPPAQIQQGRRLLTTMLANDSFAVRAAWTLALDAAAAGDWDKFHEYYHTLSSHSHDAVAGRLRTLLDSDTLVRLHCNYAAALSRSKPLLNFDSAGRVGDPFARAVLGLERGDWLAKSNQFLLADQSWSWYENSDLAGEPTGEVQPIEVDWAVGNIARLRRARVNVEGGHFPEGCAQVRRVAELWADADSTLRAMADTAAAQLSRLPCPP
jgi:serine/threonine protein kinase/tetratricopeptide (TPR) repeat protein